MKSLDVARVRELLFSLISRGESEINSIIRDLKLSREDIEKIFDKLNLDLGKASKIDLAIKYIELGGDPEKVGGFLDWRDFESFVSELLKFYGYIVFKNIRAPPPRGFEIDVIGIDPSKRRVIVIDCKHWKRSRESALREVAKELIVKIDRLFSRCMYMLRLYNEFRGVYSVIPLIVTLRETISRKIDNHVIISPVIYLRDLMNNLDLYIELLEIKPLIKTCL
ncbi:MAG: NERD domain-containing protein [Sulfolobales archaeon]